MLRRGSYHRVSSAWVECASGKMTWFSPYGVTVEFCPLLYAPPFTVFRTSALFELAGLHPFICSG
jgi:hypothetical protein